LLSLIIAQQFTSGKIRGVRKIESLNHYFDHGATMMSERVASNPAVDPKLMIRVSFAAVLGCMLFKEWMFPRGLAEKDEIRAAVIEFVLDGIGANADPGLKADNGRHKRGLGRRKVER
jgi:hypothetical protein